MKLIYETKNQNSGRIYKVYERSDGAFVVENMTAANFDGFIESVVHREVFDERGQHDDGPVVRHNLMFPYRDGDDRTPREHATDYANALAK